MEQVHTQCGGSEDIYLEYAVFIYKGFRQLYSVYLIGVL